MTFPGSVHTTGPVRPIAPRITPITSGAVAVPSTSPPPPGSGDLDEGQQQAQRQPQTQPDRVDVTGSALGVAEVLGDVGQLVPRRGDPQPVAGAQDEIGVAMMSTSPRRTWLTTASKRSSIRRSRSSRPM